MNAGQPRSLSWYGRVARRYGSGPGPKGTDGRRDTDRELVRVETKLRWGYARPGSAFVVACASLVAAEGCAAVAFLGLPGPNGIVTMVGMFGGGTVAGMILSTLCVFRLWSGLRGDLVPAVVFLALSSVLGTLVVVPLLTGGSKGWWIMPLLPFTTIFLTRAFSLAFSALLDAAYDTWKRSRPTP